MNATLEEEKVFTLTYKGVPFKDLRQQSSWEGFVKLSNGHGSMIICDGSGSYASFIDNFFKMGLDEEVAPKEVQVVSMCQAFQNMLPKEKQGA